MAVPKKLPSGNWRIRICYTDEKGKQIRKSFTAETKREASHLADKFMTEHRHDSKLENKTLKELSETYIENRYHVLSPSTINGYRSILRNVPKFILETRVGLLTKEDYQAAINQYTIGRSPKTVKEAHSLLNKVLKENNINIAENVILPKKKITETNIPSTQEIADFLTYIKGTRTELFVAFSVYLGLRKSEILSIKWKNIDLNNRTVKIDNARVKDEFGEFVEKEPKTPSSKRTLKMPDVLFDLLPKKQGAEEYVINDSPTAVYSLYKRQAAKSGFNYNFHALRHYFASVMLRSGMPNKYAQERMGHATENMLKNVYQHTFKDKQKEYDVLLNDFFSNANKPKEETE